MQENHFELENTLIPSQESFNTVKKEISQHIAKLFQKDVEEVMAAFEKQDLNNTEDFGLSRLRFPTSWCDTYAYFGGKNLEEECVIWDMAERVFKSNNILSSEEKNKARHLC